MLGEGVEPGDQLIVNIAEENISWGYEPCKNGTIVEVVRFGEFKHNAESADVQKIKPGVYVNRSWIYVRLPDGREEAIWDGFFKPLDEKKYIQRKEEWLKKHSSIFGLFEFLRGN